MMTCMIVDDEPLAVQLLESHIRQAGNLQLLHTCYHALEAHQVLKRRPVDLLFLDINMPRLSGMELVSLLSPGQKIIFTTAYSEYAVQSYEKDAVDYLLKPISFERFMKAVDKAEKWMQQPAARDTATASVFLKSGRTLVNIQFDSVLFIEGLKDYVAFHTLEEKIVVYKRMKELEESLPPYFVRVHNSYFVNTRQISRVEDNQVVIASRQIPVSEKYREPFLQKIRTGLL